MNRSIKEIINEQLKKQSQISEKQKAVLNSATVLFSERGFYNTSTKDIARMAKVSEGTVYKHFKTKNELLYAGLLPLYKSVVAPEVLKEFSSELSKCDNLDAFIDTFVDNRIKFIDNNKNIIKIIFGEIMYTTDFLNIMTDVVEQSIGPTISQYIQNLKDNNQIDKDIPADLAFRMMASQTISVMLPVLLSQDYSKSKLNENIILTKQLLIKMLR